MCFGVQSVAVGILLVWAVDMCADQAIRCRSEVEGIEECLCNRMELINEILMTNLTKLNFIEVSGL